MLPNSPPKLLGPPAALGLPAAGAVDPSVGWVPRAAPAWTNLRLARVLQQSAKSGEVSIRRHYHFSSWCIIYTRSIQ